MVRRRRTTRRKRSSGAAGFFLAALFVLILAAAGVAWLVFWPYGPEKETFVELVPGSSTLRIGQQLQAEGIVRSQSVFDLLRWWKRGSLRAG